MVERKPSTLNRRVRYPIEERDVSNNYSGQFGRIRDKIPTSDLEMAFVLDFILSRESAGQKTRMTNLVQSLTFGTGPTVQRKVKALTSDGRMESKICKDDSRVKELVVTSTGKKWIASLEQKLA